MKSLVPRIRTALLVTAAVAATVGAVGVALVRSADPVVPVAFSLTDHTGATVSQGDFAGRHLLVFFGFTNCLHICPTQMSKLTSALAKLDQSGHASQVTPIFVSVDPERDTPDQVARFLNQFDHRFVGLTGSRAALTAAAASFKAYLQAAPPAAITDYQVVHATTVYIVDTRGGIVGYISGSQDADAIAAQVQKALG